jgi:phosphoserine aminotransferase
MASVQKCLGLPAGLGIIIISPNALQKAQKIQENKHYNSILFLEENFSKYQTPYTPNILGIYLLNQWAKEIQNIQKIATKIEKRAKNFYQFIENNFQYAQPLTKDNQLRSSTILVFEVINDFDLAYFFQEALNQNIILGKGYGRWKENTFRIANFPQITNKEFKKLQDFLSKFKPK